MKVRHLRNFKAFKVWSNTFYLAPFILALYWNIWITAALVAAVVVFGTLYHLTQEKEFYLPDVVAAWSLIAYNLYICYLGHFQAPYFWIGVLFVALALTYHFYLQALGQYSLNHGMWHLYGALITVFCLFTFVL